MTSMQCRLKQIKKAFGKQVIFQDLNFDISHPGFYMISGKSGSGKTTFLNILAGYEPYDQGIRELAEGCSIACIFQNYELIPALSVRDNIELYPQLHHCAVETDELISLLGLSSLLDHYPEECSQGQKQRIGIARALLMNPAIILCDEPTESLDQENKEIVMELLVSLSKTKAVIVATHEKELIMQYNPIVYELKDHQLICEQAIKVASLLQPAPLEEPVNQAVLKRILTQIHRPTRKLQTIILTILSICFLGLLQAYLLMFHVSNTENVLNANEIYIQTYSDASVSIPFTNEPILNFNKLTLKGKEVSVLIVPYIENTKNLPIEGEKPSGFSVLINQNMAALLEETSEKEVIGSKLRCSYLLNTVDTPIEFTINGIIEEEDAGDTLQVYYDQEALHTSLANEPSSYTKLDDKGNEIPMSRLDVMKEKTRFFVGHIEPNNLEYYYEKAKEVSGIGVQNVILDERYHVQNERSLYRIVFLVMLGLLGMAQVVYMFYSAKKDREVHAASYAILYSCHTPLHLIKTLIMKMKLQLIFLICIILGIESIIFCLLFDLNQWEYYSSFVYAFILLVLYIVSVFFNNRRIHKEQIALILKDEQDH